MAATCKTDRELAGTSCLEKPQGFSSQLQRGFREVRGGRGDPAGWGLEPRVAQMWSVKGGAVREPQRSVKPTSQLSEMGNLGAMTF